ncbi:MAG: hypothetical protein OEY14_06835 [Myxococcales bacterium]|nr:hypothetical protein [Myxococcales bacterium]
MDELEERLRRRDGRFLIRLLILLAIAFGVGLLAFSWLTDDRVGACAARGFGEVTAAPPAE